MKQIESDDRATFSALDRHECLVLLRWEVIGRLAVAAPGEAPTVVPVNFTMDGDTILFRTGPGEKLDRLHDEPVSFQVDRFDWFRRIGWSVLVKGRAIEMPEDPEHPVDVDTWAPGDRPTLVRIEPTLITGRRIELETRALDRHGYL
jgi:nitroimidazol reductase NimA-like FMN-containing flavoprotein (pyridoxamine 5'-phosphate oxidase superfamily)